MSGDTEASNKARVLAYVEAIWNDGRLAEMDDFVAPDYRFVPPDGTDPLLGPDGLRQHVATLRDTLSGLHMTVDRMIAEDDWVAWTWTMTGRHAGSALGPPTGRTVKTRGVALYRMRGGCIVEREGEADVLGLLSQLGKLPPELGL